MTNIFLVTNVIAWWYILTNLQYTTNDFLYECKISLKISETYIDIVEEDRI
jgi:hypothetical protein